jgi:hypothetical protein
VYTLCVDGLFFIKYIASVSQIMIVIKKTSYEYCFSKLLCLPKENYLLID